MTPERWKQIEELYHSAVDSGEEARTALFAQASPDVRNTVIEMLAQQSAENILDRPAWEGAAEFVDLAARSTHGRNAVRSLQNRRDTRPGRYGCRVSRFRL